MDYERGLDVSEKIHPVMRNTLLKMLLNIHSTLVMGRRGRYQSNVMTYVHPTNGKLVDRASRYVMALLKEQGVEVSYEKVVHQLFEDLPRTQNNESVVLKVVESLRR